MTRNINKQIISFLPEGENIDEYYKQNSIDPTIGTINGITVKNEKIYSNDSNNVLK